MSYQRNYHPRHYNHTFTQPPRLASPGGNTNFQNGVPRMRPAMNTNMQFAHTTPNTRMHHVKPHQPFPARHNGLMCPRMRSDFQAPGDFFSPPFNEVSSVVSANHTLSNSFSPNNHNHVQWHGEFPSHRNQNNPNGSKRSDNTNYKYEGKNKKQGQQKTEKGESVEQPQYYCDSCDRGFKMEKDFTDHNNKHEKCRVPGCSYVAAPKLVQLHFKLQHSTGLAKKIWSGDSEEDVKKWIEERKKNYPTASNVEKKKVEESEKRARGELIETKYFGKMKNNSKWRKEFDDNNEMNSSNCNDGKNKYNQNRKRKRKHNPRKFNSFPNENSSQKRFKDSDVNSPTNDDKVVSTSSSDQNNTVDPNNNCEDRLKSGSITSENQHKEADISKPEVKGDMCHDESNREYLASATDGNEMKNTETMKDQSSIKTNQNRRHPQDSRRIIPRKADLFRPHRSSLLEKLLAEEIRRERNIILQCVHYVAKTNFFEKTSHGHSKKSEDTCDSMKDSLCCTKQTSSSQSECLTTTKEIWEHTRTMEENGI